MPPRIRTLRPEIWHDERLARCSLTARLVFVGLITQADDEGRQRGSPALVRGAIFPYDDLPLDSITGTLDELSEAGLIRRYNYRGEAFIDLPRWAKNQRINRAQDSALPAFERRDKNSTGAEENTTLSSGFTEPYVSAHGLITEPSRTEGKGVEGKGEEPPPSRVTPAHASDARPREAEEPGGGGGLSDSFAAILANYRIAGLTRRQEQLVAAAFALNPNGVIAQAKQTMGADNPTAAFMARLDNGQHTTPAPERSRRVGGWPHRQAELRAKGLID